MPRHAVACSDRRVSAIGLLQLLFASKLVALKVDLKDDMFVARGNLSVQNRAAGGETCAAFCVTEHRWGWRSDHAVWG